MCVVYSTHERWRQWWRWNGTHTKTDWSSSLYSWAAHFSTYHTSSLYYNMTKRRSTIRIVSLISNVVVIRMCIPIETPSPVSHICSRALRCVWVKHRMCRLCFISIYVDIRSYNMASVAAPNQQLRDDRLASAIHRSRPLTSERIYVLVGLSWFESQTEYSSLDHRRPGGVDWKCIWWNMCGTFAHDGYTGVYMSGSTLSEVFRAYVCDRTILAIDMCEVSTVSTALHYSTP